MFFLEAAGADADDLAEQWDELGEEVSIVGSDGLWNCHIHTDRIGAVIESALAFGRPAGIQVTDLSESPGVLEVDLAEGGFSPLIDALDAPVGVVAAASGPGWVERFRRMGAQQVVVGFRPPDLDAFLSAVQSAPANKVIVLPNNRALVAVAEQVDALTTKTVAVVPTRSLVQGVAAMAAYVPSSGDLEGLVDDMAAAAGAVDFGEVTRATHDASVDGWVVTRGDWLGVADGRVVVADADRFAALRGLVAAILGPHVSRLTVHTGEGSARVDTKALEAWLSDTHPRVAVSAVGGGQRTAPYLVAAE